MPAQDHSDVLINALLPFAQHMLAEHGEFLPFGSVINAAGQVEALGGLSGDERPHPQKQVEFMQNAARAMAAQGLCKAAGLCVAVQVQLPGTEGRTDAAMAILEDATGAIQVFLPFTKNSDGSYEYGDLTANHAEPSIFVASAG